MQYLGQFYLFVQKILNWNTVFQVRQDPTLLRM